MKHNLLSILFLLSAWAVFQNCNTNKAVQASLNLSADFPEDYLGKWKGRLMIYNASAETREVPMGLEILPIEGSEHLSFRILYGEDKPENYRMYELITINKTKGEYKIDEKNSIFIDAYYLGDKLFQTFEVGGNMLTSSLSKKGSNLIWEVTSTKLKPKTMSGDQDFEGEQIPEVKSYATKVFQKCILSKIE